jgi:hypothetical protein
MLNLRNDVSLLIIVIFLLVFRLPWRTIAIARHDLNSQIRSWKQLVQIDHRRDKEGTKRRPAVASRQQTDEESPKPLFKSIEGREGYYLCYA